jgi:hypothetical protein
MVSNERPTILLRAGAFGVVTAENVLTVNFGIKNEPESVWFPLFAGTEPAERFLQSLGDKGKGMIVFQLASPEELETLLADLKSLGTTHVNFAAEVSALAPIPIDEAVRRLGNPTQWGAVG